MILRDAPRKTRIQATVWLVGFVAGGVLALWLALADLLAALRSAAAGSPVVEFWPPSLVGLPLALMMVCLAAMVLLPTAPPTGRKRGTPAAPRGAGTLMAIAIACMPLTFLAAPIGRALVPAMIEARDYQRCADTDGRFRSLRWTRTHLTCP